MKQEHEYIKPRVLTYDSRRVVESLGSAAAGAIVSGGVDDTIPDGIPADDI